MFNSRRLASLVVAASLFVAANAAAESRVVIDEAPTVDAFAEMLFGAPPPAGIKMRGIVMHSDKAREAAQVATPKVVAAPVKFAFNSSDVPADFKPTLESLAKAMATPEAAGKTLVISGHTDPMGPDTYNQALSKQRASAVAAFLIERGVPSSRLVTQGLGESELLSPTQNHLNRRVEFEAR